MFDYVKTFQISEQEKIVFFSSFRLPFEFDSLLVCTSYKDWWNVITPFLQLRAASERFFLRLLAYASDNNKRHISIYMLRKVLRCTWISIMGKTTRRRAGLGRQSFVLLTLPHIILRSVSTSICSIVECPRAQTIFYVFVCVYKYIFICDT